jgi:hypothetical protein
VYDLFYYRFSPDFTSSSIAYSKTRVAVIANISTGKAFHASGSLSSNDYMLGIRFLNPQENLFVYARSIRMKNEGMYDDYLQIARLEGEKLVGVGSLIKISESHNVLPGFPAHYRWFVHDRKLFAYDNSNILCTDGKQPVSHPFSETFNAYSQRIGNIKDLAIHPTLPFGVVIEDRASFGILHRPVVVRWDTNEIEKQIASHEKTFEALAKLFGLDRMTLAYQSFSPDGNWYVVACIASGGGLREVKNPYFVAIPVNQGHPGLLDMGNIVVLGQVKDMTSLAWTSNPAAYVVSNGQLLHKWNLNELPKAR